MTYDQTGPSAGSPRFADQIQREIHATQESLSRTIAEIERRFSPHRIADDVMGFLHSDGGSRITEAIRRNPLPAALIAIGAVWLAVSVLRAPGEAPAQRDVAAGRRRAVLSAGSLIGDEVRNLENERLGKLEEIMIDVPTGRIAYAVLSFGTILGMGGKLFAIPWDAVRVDERRQLVVIDIDKERLRHAPGFDKDQWPDMVDSAWTRNVRDFHLGQAAPHEVLHRRVMSAGSLGGDSVRNPAGDDLGKIEEIMIDLAAGRVAYAVMSFGTVLGMGGKLFAIPWRALRLNEDERRFVLDVGRDRLEQLPGFDKDHWPDMADPSWSGRVEVHFAP
jgi:sporulation protein YlmC with PRC-barrel domain